ncbi:MAG: GGDEF domain-containing protein [Clostridiales bacterium]|nr:GGDEF domain-containing protein [Clostridiales bacterium]
MKKKVAVFTNGWNDDYLDFALEGIRRRAAEDNIDVFIFLDYTSYDKTEDEITGELNILNLPQLDRFDGVLLLGNTLNNAGENMILKEKILKAGVPAICLEFDLEGINCIRTENTNGMKELVEHLITVHGVKDVFWISGPEDNEDNNVRYETLVRTMEEHGLTVDPERSFNGYWSYAIVEDQFPAVVSGLTELPDAFMCANDNMALAVCVVLEKAGINVPGDVIVTGYDNLMSGNHFSPALTSVDRGWDERSYQAMDSLAGLMNGAPDFGDMIYDSKFDLGESCGCSLGADGIRIQQEARKRAFLIPVERTIFDWHLIQLDDAVAHVRSAQDIHLAYKEMWEKNHDYEGGEFYVCLDMDFVDSMEDEACCKSSGYSDEIDVIYGMKDGVTVPRHNIQLSDLVPYYDGDSAETSVYVIVPLHMGADSYGYFVCRNNQKIIKDFYLNSLIRHVAYGLERAHQNIRLESLNKVLADISVRDELTGLYNRMGYEKIVIPYLDELRRSKKRSVIMVADINKMKEINDKHGHLRGDMAIKTVANVIKSTVPFSWKAVRYGGDEYVIIGDYDVSGDVNDIKNEIIEKSRQVSEDLNMPFRLSVSVVYVVVDPENDLENEEYFRMADEAMYEMKREAHKNDIDQ